MSTFLGLFQLVKIELCNTAFIEPRTVLQEIDNLQEDIYIVDCLEFEQTIYSFSNVSKEFEKDFDKQKEIHQNVKVALIVGLML